MPENSRTVDNIGIDVHKRYIDDSSLLSKEEKEIFQTPNIASSVAKSAEVLSIAPKSLETDILLGVQQKTTPFAPPPEFVLRTNIFTYNLIPPISNGEDLIQKLQSIKQNKDSAIEKEREILLKSFQTYKKLDIIRADIKKKQDEFHKG